MGKALLLVLMMGLTACTTFAPPRPPTLDNSIEGMRPINPDMISAEDLAAWEAEKNEAEAKRLSQVENFDAL